MVIPRLDRADRPGPEPSLVAAWLAAVAVGLIALGLSVWRLMPGLGFWDTAESWARPIRPGIRATS